MMKDLQRLGVVLNIVLWCCIVVTSGRKPAHCRYIYDNSFEGKPTRYIFVPFDTGPYGVLQKERSGVNGTGVKSLVFEMFSIFEILYIES